MAAPSAPAARSGTKASKKKAADKTIDRTASSPPTASPAPEKEAAEAQENGHQESDYIRELQK